MILSVSLSEDEYLSLERAAAREGRQVEQVARTAIIDYSSGWRRERERLVDGILTEDLKVLRRLGAS